jgi:glutamate synthase domain-containing protein 2
MGWLILVLVILGGTVAYDLTQRKHAILRNFPIIGHFRYWLEAVGPELRQYIVTSNDEERPFSRDQRRWIYASSKMENNYFGFGTDNDLERVSNYLIVKHATFPYRPPEPADATAAALHPLPGAKVIGAWRGRKRAFRPASVIGVSAMSFGSLSAAAVEAINRGCALSGCLHNTGEGGIAPHHDHGGDIVWQLGTGYFGARDASGDLDIALLVDKCARYRVRAVEIKLSQGAKPGKGGVLPAAKVTPEISRIRHIPVGQDCLSPAYHRAFSSADELLDLVEQIAEATGLPVGIKSAVGESDFWEELTRLMDTTGRGVDYVQIDGGEGGTGAAPLVFSDHVALPFYLAFSRIYPLFAARGLHEKVFFWGSGRLGLPDRAMLAFALGCDGVMTAREPMMAIGCIQAQRCHTGHCPTGVATQSKWLMRGLDPRDKAARLSNYMVTFRKELESLAHACGVAHPGLVTLEHLEILNGGFGARSARKVFGYPTEIGLPSAADREALMALLGAPAAAK